MVIKNPLFYSIVIKNPLFYSIVIKNLLFYSIAIKNPLLTSERSFECPSVLPSSLTALCTEPRPYRQRTRGRTKAELILTKIMIYAEMVNLCPSGE